MKPISRQTIPERRQPQMRWSAVLAGTALAIGLWILLQTLSMGLGMSAVDVDDAGNLKGLAIATGIASVIVALIAMFAGAFIVGRLSGTFERRVGAMHGSVMWALATTIGVWAMISFAGTMASGAARVGGAAASATSSMVGGAATAGGQLDAGDAMDALGLDTNDMVAPINERLEREGKPAITARQLNKTVQAVAQRGVREGKVDRAILVDELAANTALSRADAEDIATQFGDRYDELANRVSRMGNRIGEGAKDVALETADKTGKALLIGGLMMLLSLGAALAGGALGVRDPSKRRDSLDRTPSDHTTIVTPDV